jgi:hypothetical protein
VLRSCLTAPSFTKHLRANPSGETPGLIPTPALQISKFAPSHANRGAHHSSYFMVPEPVPSEARDLTPASG